MLVIRYLGVPMAMFCDTSPCQRLLSALGVWIYGLRPPQKGYTAFLTTKDGRVEGVTIDYCPFCGTRFGWTEDDVLERWVLPPRKKIAATPEIILPPVKTHTQLLLRPFQELLVTTG